MQDTDMDQNGYSDRTPAGEDRAAAHARRQGARGGSDATPGVVLALIAGAALGAAGYAYALYQRREALPHRRDSAPGRTARRSRFGDYAVTGRTVTISKPREEIYTFVRDFANLPQFMEHVQKIDLADDETMHWAIDGPAGTSVDVLTRVVSDRPGREIAWRSTEASQIDTEGKILLRDAPADRGTEVEAIIAYKPPAGHLGQWVAGMFGLDPATQGRRELKRLKMLLETGEIATSRRRRHTS